MVIELSFDLTMKELEKAVKNFGGRFWTIKKDADIEYHYISGDILPKKPISEPWFELRCKLVPFIGLIVKRLACDYLGCSKIYIGGICCSEKGIAEKLCKKIEEIKSDEGRNQKAFSKDNI